MPRFIDRLLAAKRWKTESFDLPATLFESAARLQARDALIRQDLHSVTVLAIDNVAQYYFQHHTCRDGRMDGPEQFPQLAPPFPSAFYEYTLNPRCTTSCSPRPSGHCRAPSIRSAFSCRAWTPGASAICSRIGAKSSRSIVATFPRSGSCSSRSSQGTRTTVKFVVHARSCFLLWEKTVRRPVGCAAAFGESRMSSTI